MIWQLEYMFARRYYLEELHPSGQRPAHTGQMLLVKVLGLYALALVVLVYRFTRIDLFDKVARIWPHLADGKLLRATDGLAVLVGIVALWWAHRRFNEPERYEPVLNRFLFANMPRDEFLRDRWFDVGMVFSGIAALICAGFKLDLLLAGLVLFLIYANWVIYRRFYRSPKI